MCIRDRPPPVVETGATAVQPDATTGQPDATAGPTTPLPAAPPASAPIQPVATTAAAPPDTAQPVSYTHLGDNQPAWSIFIGWQAYFPHVMDN